MIIMDYEILEAESQYSEALNTPLRISTLIVNGDSEEGQFIDNVGSLFDFEYHPDSNELYYQYNDSMTRQLNDAANGFLIASGYINEPRHDAAAFLRGMSEYAVKQDATLKCGPGSQPCGDACIPKASKCRKGRGSVSLQQGAGKRKGMGTGAKVGLGLAGAAGLAAAGAGGLAFGTKAGRAELQKGKSDLEAANQEMEEMENQAKTAINLTGEAGKQREKEVRKRYVKTGMGGIKSAVGSLGRAVKAGAGEVGFNIKNKAAKTRSGLRDKFKKKSKSDN